MASTTRPPAGDDENPVSEPGTRPPCEDLGVEIPHTDLSLEMPTGNAFPLIHRERVKFTFRVPEIFEVTGELDTVQGSSTNSAAAHMTVWATTTVAGGTPVGIGYLIDAPMQPYVIAGGVLAVLSLAFYYGTRAVKSIRARKAEQKELDDPESRSE